MADKKVAVTPGSGEDVAFSTLGGSLGDAQIVKLDLGADGASSPLIRGQQAKADSIPVALASDTGALPVTDNSGSLTVDAPVGTPVFVRLSDGSSAISMLPVTVPTDPFGANADAASATGSISAKLRFIASTGIPITGTVTVGSHAVTNGGTFAVQVDGAALTALQLIDDPVVTLGTGTYTETSSKGNVIAAVRRDADTTLVDTTNEFGPLQMDANGRLKVEAFDGGDSHTVDAPVGTPVFVRLSDGASAISTLPVSLASVPSHAVTNAGTFVVQENGSALTALQLIDDIVYTDDTSTHSTGSSKGALFMAAATPTDGSVNANDIGAVAMTTDRKLHVAVMDALPAGTAAIGKLAANSGVDIGDVDVTSVIPGTGATNLGKAEDGGHTTGDVGVMALGVYNATLAAISGTDLDYTPLATEKTGRVVTAPFAPVDATVTGTASATDTTSTSVIAAGAGSLRNYITSVQAVNTGSTTVLITLQDGSGGTALARTIAPAGGGSNVYFPVPIKTTAATALYFAAGGSSTTVYVSAQGYRAL